MCDRPDDVQAGPRSARERELPLPQVRRDVRSVDRRPLDSLAAPGAGGAEVDAARKKQLSRYVNTPRGDAQPETELLLPDAH